MNTRFIREVQRKPLDSAEQYLQTIPAIKFLKRLTLDSAVTFLIGENGSGKSTLLEAIAVCCGFNAEGGTRNFNFSTKATHSGLHQYLKLVRGYLYPTDGFFLRAESFYNVASEVERLDAIPTSGGSLYTSYGGDSLHHQSHGESFLSLVKHRFGGNGLYLLDEPEAALSPMRQFELLCLIDKLVRDQSQFIIATHSPILMAYPGAKIYLMDQTGIHTVPYEQTDHYQLTRQFLNNPSGMLRELLDDG